MKQHHFDIEDAKEFGVEEAIVINCFQWWIETNRANGRNQHDGKTWTYNSVKALTQLFPYWTPKQMRRIMDRLELKGILVVGNYNEKAYDKTKWYAFADETRFLKPFARLGNGSNETHCPNGQMELPKRANGIAQTGKPIPVNNQLPIPVNNKQEFDFEKEWNWFWNEYDYKKGEHKTKMEFANLDTNDYNAIRDHLPKYKKSILGTSKKYWLSPLNYITGKHYNDEIVTDDKPEEQAEKPRAGFVLPIRRTAEQFKRRAQ